jgi:hypothetical protein
MGKDSVNKSQPRSSSTGEIDLVFIFLTSDISGCVDFC